jgi:hypothetical protein
MKKNNKKAIIISLLALMIFLSVVWLYTPVIFQEGNPCPLISGILRLNFGGDEIVKLKTGDNRYMTKSKNGREIINKLMRNQGYEFTEQMGSGYFFRSKGGENMIAVHRYYSRYYSLWKISGPNSGQISTEWVDYENKEYGFALQYPAKSIHSQFWTGLSEEFSINDVLIPNRILAENNNFYLNQQYSLGFDWQNGKFIKKENTFVPEYDGQPGYGTSWHIIILEARDEKELDSLIKQKYGSGCGHGPKQETVFAGSYDLKLIGDGKDLGSTACPVNYKYYIRYSPARKKVAFWQTGQECIIGLSFDDCFDQKISDSFHFIN